MGAHRTPVPGHDVVGLRAGNPGPFTLAGTNTWVVGRAPAWVVDPGPDLTDHVVAVGDEIRIRGGLGGIALTHDHADHSGAIAGLRAAFPGVPLGAARLAGHDRAGHGDRDGDGHPDVGLRDGDRFGPFTALALPGHAPDHLVLRHGRLAFTGDAVLGEGSVFVAPDPGALVGYLDGLRRLRELAPELLAPGHGPLVTEADAKLAEYLAHRLDREQRLLDALASGARSVDELLDAAWSEVPVSLRAAAAVTLAAHLDKLSDEGRLPDDVQRPRVPDLHGVG